MKASAALQRGRATATGSSTRTPKFPPKIPSDRAQWDEVVRGAPEEVLAGLLIKRISNPGEYGPHIDVEDGEAPEDTFVEKATPAGRDTDDFRKSLGAAVAIVLSSDDYQPSRAAKEDFASLFGLVQKARLEDACQPIVHWLDRSMGAYVSARHPPNELVEHTWLEALLAIAVSQSQYDPDMEPYWKRLWDEGPEYLRPQIFVGLRMNSPSAALEYVPELIKASSPHFEADLPEYLHRLWADVPEAFVRSAASRPEARNIKELLLKAHLEKAEREEIKRSFAQLTPSKHHLESPVVPQSERRVTYGEPLEDEIKIASAWD
jgi:hypothetical protein